MGHEESLHRGARPESSNTELNTEVIGGARPQSTRLSPPTATPRRSPPPGRYRGRGRDVSGARLPEVR